ncbi:MAG: hypothetical protein AAGG06_03235 [Pseudomonadota bacterium]
MDWHPPDDYKPIRGVAAYLMRIEVPETGSAEARLIQIVINGALPRDVGMNAEMARDLIDRRIVPTGIYPSVLATALRRDCE